MTALELKNSVLQLAVQGKLVPQCKDDEPASELLKRIRAFKEKAVKKEKPLPAISEEEIPFDIPENWEWVRLNDISSITSGGTPARTNSYFWNGNIPWVKIGDIRNKYIDTTEEKITEQGLNSSSAKIFPKGTILYTIFATIGTVGILNIDAATNQAVAGVTFFGEYSRDYMYYVLIGLKDILASKGKGMAQMNINLTILKNTPIPLPPLAEQKRIVEKIEELMPLIEEYGKAEEQLSKLNAEFPDKLRKSVLQQAVQGKLTERDPADEPASELLKRIKAEKEALIGSGKIKKEKPLPPISDDEKPFDIPDTWEWVRLGDLATKFTDGTHSTPKYTSTGIPFLSVKDMSKGYLDFTHTKFISREEHDILYKRCNPEKGDLLITKVGTTGIPVIVNTNKQFSLFVSVALMKFSQHDLLGDYLCNIIKSPLVQEQAKENTRGVGNKNWVLDYIRNTIIPLPPINEQKRIVKRVEELFALCDELK